MARSLTGKSHNGLPNSIGYGALQSVDFDLATLVNSQPNTTAVSPFPLGLNLKIVAVSVVCPTVVGAAALSINIALGTAAESGIGPVDSTPVGVVPSVVAASGNTYWAADQQVNAASAPVANTVYNLYPLSDAEDIIWPSGSLPLTLRFVAGAAAVGTIVKVVAWCMIVDRFVQLPNGANPFACTAAQL